jgi:hypothetical protein
VQARIKRVDDYVNQIRRLILLRNALAEQDAHTDLINANLLEEADQDTISLAQQMATTTMAPPKIYESYNVDATGETVTSVQALSLLYRCATT